MEGNLLNLPFCGAPNSRSGPISAAGACCDSEVWADMRDAFCLLSSRHPNLVTMESRLFKPLLNVSAVTMTCPYVLTGAYRKQCRRYVNSAT